VFRGSSDRVLGQTQQERQFGRHEKLQSGQHDENRLSTDSGRNLQHQTVDAPEPHTLRYVLLGYKSAVRGVPPHGLWVVSRFIA